MELFCQLLWNGFVSGSLYALLGVSWGIIYSTSRVFHFAHAAVYTIAAYIAVAIVADLHWPIVVGVIGGIAGAIIAGVAMEVGLYSPMRKRQATLFTIFLVSLGALILIENVITLIFGSLGLTMAQINVHPFVVGLIAGTDLDIATAVLAWAVIAGTILFLRKTQQGRALHAVRVNASLAMSVGIDIAKVYRLAFAIGSALAAVAALLFLAGGQATPTMGELPNIYAVIAVFLAGSASVGGAAGAGLLIGLVSSISGMWVSPEYAPAIVFALLYFVMVFRPGGLFIRRARLS